MINILQSDTDHFDRVIHLADIHIRLNKRHDEYREIFEKFYNHLDEISQSTMVVIAGDIFENKIDLSPESVRLCKDFFVNVSDRFPTILIAGNHDCSLSNKSRLDSLTPIVEAVKHPNLHYLRESGLYAMGNVLFNNMSILGSTENYVRGESIPQIYRNKYHHIIGLYHGSVDGSTTDMGYTVSNREISPGFFDGHHIVMLGDIHKPQTLQEYNDDESVLKPVIRYPGSFIVQNHGESSSGHGYTDWNLNTKTYCHMEIPNDYGYFTIDISNGELSTIIDNIPLKCRLRVRCFESTIADVKNIITDLHNKSDIKEIIYERVPSDNDSKELIITDDDLNLSDLVKPEHQNALITKYLKNKLKIDDDDKIKLVLDINDEINNYINKENKPKGIRWKPKKFEWSNLMSYGENNVIDFTKIKGLYGLFAPNRSGKSGIMTALSFCIFDKYDRGNKAVEILNSHKSNFSCKFNFSISDVDFFIERNGTLEKNGNVKVDVDFWKIENGEKVSLNGQRRSETNEKIREYLGTYDDFVLTSLSVQNVKNAASFIDMGHAERKDVLAQFLGLGIFDELHDVANKKLNELSIIVKSFRKEDETKLVSDLKSSIIELNSNYIKITDEKLKLMSEKDVLNNDIIDLTSKLIKLDDSVGNWTDDQILVKIKENQNEIEKSQNILNSSKKSFNDGLPQMTSIINQKQAELQEIEEKISSIEKKNIPESYKKYQTHLAEYNRLNSELERLILTINNQKEKISHLSKHEYDPNCKYCVNNVFVKDAIKTKSDLSVNENKKNELSVKVSLYEKNVKEFEWVVNEQNVYNRCLSERNKIKDTLTLANNKIADAEKFLHNQEKQITESIRKYQETISEWQVRLKKFRDNKDAIQSNFKIGVDISTTKNKLKTVDDKIKELDRSVADISRQIGSVKSKIEQSDDKIKSVEKNEKKIELYDLYVKSVCRDGIPYELICGAVPEIEREVNIILNQISEFSAIFETDGKNIVPYLVSNNMKWAMGMSSGLEGFALGIAIRVALINISNLPRPTFLIIDEGFGTADSDHLSRMSSLFGFLRSNFDFIIIISHLDTMKDIVDGKIEIAKENDFSSVNFV